MAKDKDVLPEVLLNKQKLKMEYLKSYDWLILLNTAIILLRDCGPTGADFKLRRLASDYFLESFNCVDLAMMKSK